MSIPCPVPQSNHPDIPEGTDQVGTLQNLLKHLEEQDRPFLEQKCKDLIGVLTAPSVPQDADTGTYS